MAKKKAFRIDARAILTWGRESIRDHTTAILELVKNSYDAGATVVELNVNIASGSNGNDKDEDDDEEDDDAEEVDESLSGSFISITDDGEGMSEADVDSNWLSIGYSNKRTSKKTRSGRRKTGEKGVGRISADRLGGTVELRTQKKQHPAYGLFVDWSLFEQSGQNVDDVPIEPVASPSFHIPRPSVYDEDNDCFLPAPTPVRNSASKSGTRLVIRDIRDAWTKSEIKDLRDALSVLTPPFGGVQDFQIRIKSTLERDTDEVIQSPFFKNAELELTCTIDNAGAITSTFSGRSEDGKRLRPRVTHYKWNEFVHEAEHGVGATESDLLKVPIFGAARVTLLFYPRRSETLRGTALLMTDLREFLDQNAGVKVYRDNIRVAPYGDPQKPEGDWLGLGERKARNPAGAGRPDFRVAPGQLVGAVFITRDGNQEIADTTNREGLIHSNAFYQLKAFVRECILQLEGHYHEAFVAQQKKKPTPLPAREVVGTLRERLRTITASLEDVTTKPNTRSSERALEMIANVTTGLKESEQSLEELATQPIVYRALATLGIAASTFGHETLGSIEGVDFSIKEALDELQDEPVDHESVVEELEKAANFTARIAAWGKFALGRVKRDKRRRRYCDVADLVQVLIDEVRAPFEGSSILLRSALHECKGKVFPMDVEAILLNLLTNAYFFSKKASRDRVIRVDLKAKTVKDKDGFVLGVSDSGPGVPEDRYDKIWEPLYSTKIDAKSGAAGTGLGLAIIDSVVQDSGGWRSVGVDAALKGARFDVWIPFG